MDAGSRPPDFYKQRLSPVRYWWRQRFADVVHVETPWLARLQALVQHPILDAYFGYTANIGTHTFYMLMLPMFFWYNNIALGFDVIWVLATGVYLSGTMKDYLCLPRPRSPPVHRISMSKSAAREYGLPSTHSCNAVSVALVFYAHYPKSRFIDLVSQWLVITLVSGRLYTGMHGFTDIASGCGLGVVTFYILKLVHLYLPPSSVCLNTLLTGLIVYLIKISPRPVESCPCFEDTVAFCGVVLGMMWTLCFGKCRACSLTMDKVAGPITVSTMTLALLRFLVGVSVVVVWRLSSKKWSVLLGRWISRYISRTSKDPSEISYPVAVFFRLVIYGGIGPMVLEVAPMLINALGV